MLVSLFLAYLLINPVVPAQTTDAPPPPAPAVFAPLPTPMPCMPPELTSNACATADAAPMVSRVYEVADLVVPFVGKPIPAPAAEQVDAPACPTPCSTIETVPAQHTTDARLMALIRAQVAPGSWAGRGGAAMAYEPVTMALVVRQTPQRQEQIARLLETLRKTQDTQVVVEVRMVAVPDDFHGFGGGSHPDGRADSGTASPFFLDGTGLQSFLRAALADRRTKDLAMPRLTVANGQDAKIEVTEQKFFVTDLKETPCNGGVVYLPHNQSFTTGTSLEVQAVVSADRRYVKMKVAGKDSQVAPGGASLVPVTTFVTPKFEGGSEGQPIPFTQFVQCPTFNVQAFARTLVVPDGKTAVFLGWKRTRPVQGLAPDFLGDLPFLSCLVLKACQSAAQVENVMVLVTPHILTHQEMEAKPPARVASTIPQAGTLVPVVYEEARPVCAPSRLANILADYQAACVRGDRAAATQWAVQALAVDPTCFQKKATK